MGISREKVTAMLAVLNKRWLSQGWRVMDPKDSEPMALTWIELLDKNKIPFQHYHELYTRSIGLRSARMQQGLKCDDFSVDMMIACWPSLKNELKQKEIEARNLLPENAESVCQHCFGTGFRIEMVDGYRNSRKCDHTN